MKEIQLTKGYVAQVSDEDYERLSKYKWQANVGTQVRAIRSTFRGRVAERIYMHHEVLNVKGADLKAQGLEVDHEDRNPLNNQRGNLKIKTHADNMQNTLRSINKIGYCYNKRADLWSCYLDRPGQKRKYLGYARTEAEAKQRVMEARNAGD